MTLTKMARVMVETGDARLDEVREGVAVLLIAGRVDRQDPLDEQAALFALCTVADPTPGYGMPDYPLCDVVDWLHSFVVDEGPEVLRFRYMCVRFRGPICLI
jgi:hypothetical protein